MQTQKIKSEATSECCDECGKFSYQRVIIGRLDLFNKKRGTMIAPDLFHSKLCKNCFTLVIQNTFDELQNTPEKGTKKATQKKG